MKLSRTVSAQRPIFRFTLITALAALAMLASGHESNSIVEALSFKTDNLVVTSTATVGTSLNIGASSLTEVLTAKSNSGQFGLQTTAGPNSFEITSSGTTIWDFNPKPAVNTDNQNIRFFRNTVTSGLKTLTLTIGNSATAGITLDPNNQSVMIHGMQLSSTTAAVDVLDIVHSPGTFTANMILESISAASVIFDTTAAPITITGLNVSVPSNRTAGANPLTNIAVKGDAISADNNYALYADHGDIRLGSGHFRTQGAAVSFSAGGGCGTGPVCNSTTCNDVAGTFTTGTLTTTCVITFANSYIGTDDAGCFLQAIGISTNPVFLTDASTINASTIVAAQKYHYFCPGH